MASTSEPRAFVRKRKLPFERLFWLIANFRNRSMQSEINQFLEDCAGDEAHVQRLDDSAVFRARRKLSPRAYQEMNEHCLAFAQEHGQLKLWKDYRLCAVDGSTLHLPAEGDIPEFFPPHTDKGGAPVGPPLARISLLYDPLNKSSLSAELDPMAVAEIDQLRDHRWEWQPGQLLLADRHYGAFWVFAWLNGRTTQTHPAVRGRRRGGESGGFQARAPSAQEMSGVGTLLGSDHLTVGPGRALDWNSPPVIPRATG